MCAVHFKPNHTRATACSHTKRCGKWVPSWRFTPHLVHLMMTSYWLPLPIWKKPLQYLTTDWITGAAATVARRRTGELNTRIWLVAGGGGRGHLPSDYIETKASSEMQPQKSCGKQWRHDYLAIQSAVQAVTGFEMIERLNHIHSCAQTAEQIQIKSDQIKSVRSMLI